MYRSIITSFVVFISCGVVLSEYYHHPSESNELDHHDVGYSYAKFSGPVSGPDHKIIVKDAHGHGESYDFVAKPDYHFEYGVEDPKTHVSQSRKEHRHGDDVVGEYSYAQPDGKIQTVKYNADGHHGFQAEVLIDGKPLHYEALQEQQAHLEAQKQYLAAQEQHAGHHYQQPEEVHHHVPIAHHSSEGDDESSYAGYSGGYSENGGDEGTSEEDGFSGYYKK